MAWNFDTMKETLSEMEKDDYQEFIKAFLSLELSISDRTILNQVYQDYMGEDDLSLISDELRVKVDGYLDEVQADMTDILEKLYRTGEGSSFIMDLMSSNSLSDTLEQYEVLDGDDYSSLSLETNTGYDSTGLGHFQSGLFWRPGSPCLEKRFTRPEKSFLTTLCDNCNRRNSTRKRQTSLGPRLTQRAEKHSQPFLIGRE